jgi:hypothetical protein
MPAIMAQCSRASGRSLEQIKARAFARSISRASARQGVGTQQGANQGVLMLAAPRKIAPCSKIRRLAAASAIVGMLERLQ